MKKPSSKKPLTLSTHTVRPLADRDLERAAGGMMNNSSVSRCWVSGCTCPPLK
jgi:hypothetical protein